MKTQIKLMQVKKHGILRTLWWEITGMYPLYSKMLMDAENVDTVQLIGKNTLNGVYKGNGVYEFEIKTPSQYTLYVNGIEQSDWTNIFIPNDVKI